VTDGATGAPDASTVEVLRRVKAVEAEWETKLRAAREDADQGVRRAREEADATVKAVAAEAEAEKAQRLAAGRTAAEAEAEAIQREGEKAADGLRSAGGKKPSDRSDELLEAVLGPYARD